MRIVLKKGTGILIKSESRSKGLNINNGSNIPSYHAEQLLLRKMSVLNPDLIKTKGKGLFIKINNHGKNSKPCKMCWKLMAKSVPYCKVIYVNGENNEVCNSLNNIEEVNHSFGTRTRLKF